jgi:hypothetical protein
LFLYAEGLNVQAASDDLLFGTGERPTFLRTLKTTLDIITGLEGRASHLAFLSPLMFGDLV